MEALLIEKEALNLPENERSALIDKLIVSISSPSKRLRDSWIRECDDRMEALKNGEIFLMETHEAIAKARASLQS